MLVLNKKLQKNTHHTYRTRIRIRAGIIQHHQQHTAHRMTIPPFPLVLPWFPLFSMMPYPNGNISGKRITLALGRGATYPAEGSLCSSAHLIGLRCATQCSGRQNATQVHTRMDCRVSVSSKPQDATLWLHQLIVWV